MRSGNEIWNYLPKVNKVIKLPSSMMASSWMGSHFTNDDLVKESRMADDYSFELTFEGKKDDQEVLEVTCHPNPDAAVVWGKVVVTVRTEDQMPTMIRYFDEDLDLTRTMKFEDFKIMGGRLIPAKMIIQPTNKPTESTIVEYHEMEFNIEFDSNIFSLRSLKS